MARRSLLCSSWIAISCTFVAFRAFAAGQLSVDLHPIADTGLYEIAPTNNLGASPAVPVGVHAGGKRSRYLVRFDPMAVLPTGALVTGAQLNIQVTVAGTPAADYTVHRLLSDWSEGNKDGNNGAPASSGETTWLARFYPDTLWVSPGADSGLDYVQAPSATLTVGDSGSTNSFNSPLLASDVQLWLQNPATNFGWLIRAQDETTSQAVRRFASRETGVTSPVLMLSYRVGPVLYSRALSNGAFTFCFIAEANRAYRVEASGTLPDTLHWETLSNIPPSEVIRECCVSEALTGRRRFYQVVQD